MSQETKLKHLRTKIFDVVETVCVNGTADQYQEAQAFSDLLRSLIIASNPQALRFLLEGFERNLKAGDFDEDEEDGTFHSAEALKEVRDLRSLLDEL